MQLIAPCLHHDFYRDEEVMVRGNFFFLLWCFSYMRPIVRAINHYMNFIQ